MSLIGPYEPYVLVVSLFFGIVIRMYHDEHPPAHFHAAYPGFEAFVQIADGEVLHGELPRKAARLVRQWALDHREALMANWGNQVPATCQARARYRGNGGTPCCSHCCWRHRWPNRRLDRPDAA
ncbi:MAG: DUF4160 domain-containing protein [Allosphingosinicella sp.]